MKLYFRYSEIGLTADGALPELEQHGMIWVRTVWAVELVFDFDDARVQTLTPPGRWESAFGDSSKWITGVKLVAPLQLREQAQFEVASMEPGVYKTTRLSHIARAHV